MLLVTVIILASVMKITLQNREKEKKREEELRAQQKESKREANDPPVKSNQTSPRVRSPRSRRPDPRAPHPDAPPNSHPFSSDTNCSTYSDSQSNCSYADMPVHRIPAPRSSTHTL